MADEISVTTQVRLSNGDLEDQFSTTKTFDQTTARMMCTVVDVGTTEETIALGDLAAPKMIYLTNLDDTNYVEFGVDSSGFIPMGRVYPGDPSGAIPAAASITYQLKANTAACDVKVRVYEG